VPARIIKIVFQRENNPVAVMRRYRLGDAVATVLPHFVCLLLLCLYFFRKNEGALYFGYDGAYEGVGEIPLRVVRTNYKSNIKSVAGPVRLYVSDQLLVLAG
jgi:hypothetical protein